MGKIDLHNYEAYLLDFAEGNLSESEIDALKTFIVLHPELNIDLENMDLPYFSEDEISADFKNDLVKSEENLPDERIINYVEGILSAEEKIRFENDLLKDPILKSDLAGYMKTILAPDEQEAYASKNELLKSEEELALNDMAFLYTEGLLNNEQALNFENEVQNNTTLQQEVELYRRSKLIADDQIIFPDKESLKKEPKVIVLFSRRVMAVAAAILLIIGLSIVFKFYNSSSREKIEIAKKNNKKNNIKNNREKKQSVENENDNNKMNVVKDENDQQKQNLAEVKKSNQLGKVHLKEDSLNVQNVNNNIVKENREERNPEIRINKDSALAYVEPKNNTKQNDVVTAEKKQVLLAVEEDEEENDEAAPKSKNGFWKRAVNLAQRVNGLGVKAVKGDEKANENYMLTFNSFSIEKK